MTPAVALLTKKRIAHALHTYDHDANAASYGLEAADKLDVSPHEVFKTLVFALDAGQLAVAVIPVQLKLSLKAAAKAAGCKKAQMAEPALVERQTGYVLGGVSPLGQRKSLPTFIDESAKALPQMFVSGGRRGLEIALAPDALAALTRARFTQLTEA